MVRRLKSAFNACRTTSRGGASTLTSIYRELTRHRLFAALNVVGLALGLAVFVVLTLYVQHERSFNVFPGSDRLYLLQEQSKKVGQPDGKQPRVMGGELDLLQADFPGLVGARYEAPGGTVRTGGRNGEENVILTDPGFFRLLGWKTVLGDPARALMAPGNIVMTEKSARRWFGDAPLGRTLPVTVGGREKLYQVAAIVADRADDQVFNGGIFVRLDRENIGADYYDRWSLSSVYTILRFPSDAAADVFERRLPSFLARRAFPTGTVRRGEYSQSLMPLSKLHSFLTKADDAVLNTLLGVGGLTLAIAVLNYVNLATARSGQRAREVAMRKVLGATRPQLIGQFMSEAIVMAALATFLGMAFAEATLPWINAWGGTALGVDYGAGLVLQLLALALGVGTLAGLYPAVLISGYQPGRVLAAAGTPGGGRNGLRLRRGLVVVQFAVAVSFAIATVVMLAQVAHMGRSEIGFEREGLLIAEATDFGSLDRPASARLLTGLRGLPNVTDVTANDAAPGWLLPTQDTGVSRIDDPQRKVAATVTPIGDSYFATYRSRLLAGRLFDAHRGADAIVHSGTQLGGNVVINRSAMRYLGFRRPADAIGEIVGGDTLHDAQIIGVIEDMRFGNPRNPVRPVVYALDPLSFGSAFTIRYAGGDQRSAIDATESQWKRIAPDVAFQVVTANQSLNDYYESDRQRARLFAIGAVLAAVISCIGLYGLAAFDTTRRIQEIGIRKTLGASTADIMRMLLSGFMRPVLLANLVAWPLAYAGLRIWLTDFDDRISLSPLYFLMVSGAAAFVAVATVMGQAWHVARAEPAQALRYQ